MREGVLIYGGTFNPPHIGHLRLAIESREALGLERVDFVPSATPPHKSAKGILPFELRCRMTEAAITKEKGFACVTLEGDRPGPSYTYDTLQDYPGVKNSRNRYFLLGSQDYKLLPAWSRGLELGKVANLVVAPRGDFDCEAFRLETLKMWPDAKQVNFLSENVGMTMRLSNGAIIYYLFVPRLEISSTEIRGAWLAGKNVDWLAPGSVLKIMQQEEAVIRPCWREMECSMSLRKN